MSAADYFQAPSPERFEEGLPPGGRDYRQVGVKLAPRDFELLAEASKRYGVAPSTLARLLIVRGARVILDADVRR